MAKIISMNLHDNSRGGLLTPFLQEKSKTDIQQLAPDGTGKGKPRTPTQMSLNPKLIFVTTGLPASPHLQVRGSVQGEGLCVLQATGFLGSILFSFFSLETFKDVKTQEEFQL